jgi:ABC-type multidrug transport system fused ATPase/permease subunit
LSEVEQFTSSELIRTLDSNISQYVTRKLIFRFYLLHDTLIIVALLFFLFLLYPVLGVTFAFLMTSFFFLHTKVLSKAQRVLGREHEVATTELIQRMYSLFRFTKIIRAEGLKTQSREEYVKKRKIVLELGTKVESLNNNVKVLIEVLTYLIIIIVFISTLYLGEDFEIIPIILVGIRLLGPLNRLLSTISRLRATEISSKYLENFYNLDGLGSRAVTESLVNSKSSFSKNGHVVEVVKVSFGYSQGERVLLQELSFTLKEGQMALVQGQIGSGKSTLLDLVLGLRSPRSGEVFTFGKNPTQLDGYERSKIKFLPQEAIILKGTVRDNLLLGNPGLEDNVINELLEESGMSKVFPSLEEMVGESHKQLSGGERQLLGLMRVLLGTPKLMILDESTSSLDSQTQSRFFEILNRFKGKSAIILVSHRELPSDSAVDLRINIGVLP